MEELLYPTLIGRRAERAQLRPAADVKNVVALTEKLGWDAVRLLMEKDTAGALASCPIPVEDQIQILRAGIESLRRGRMADRLRGYLDFIRSGAAGNDDPGYL